jgi:Mitochondrial ribosomal protein (VAR1)
MLNLTNNKLLISNTKIRDINNNLLSSKDNPSSTKEWNNSIYVYNKNTLSKIPVLNLLSIEIIKSYFNLYNYILEKKLSTKIISRRLKKFTSNRIYVNKAEIKHTNNKVIISLFIFNKQKYNYITKARKKYMKAFIKENMYKKLLLIKRKAIYLLKNANILNHFLLEKLNIKLITEKGLIKYIRNFYEKYVGITLVKLELYLYYKQLIMSSELKINYSYLIYLKKYLEKIYSKNVEFNLINLRRFYLNSDIFSESIILKLTRNRRKLLIHLNKLKKKVKVYKEKNVYILHSNMSNNNNNKLYINNLDKKYMEKFVTNNIKHKYVSGFKLEAKGRLTKRYTASRSIIKQKYKGNLVNINSSYKGLSSPILRGNISSNLQYTKLSSKTRIGSFGIKGWISSN